MDEAVHDAIVAVRIDDEVTQERWFAAICSTYGRLAEADRPDWDRFVSLLGDGAVSAGVDSRLVERFVEHMAAKDPNPIETVGRMSELSSELPLLYRERAAETTEPGGAAAGGYDEAAWHAFLAEHGVRWSGAEDAWEQFRTWFVYEAGQQGHADAANGFISYVESQPDKAAAFAQYGVAIPATDSTAHQRAAVDVSVFPEVRQGDSGEWVEYLDAMLTSNGF